MRAIVISEPGGPEVLQWQEVQDPQPGPGEVVIEVAASALNRADLHQRMGNYPPPAGASEYPGLECSGRIAELGQGVSQWSVGQEVCALLAGGGYAERVAVPAEQVMPAPPGIDLVTAAGLPEVTCTVWSNLVMVGKLEPGQLVLVHGGSGGIGSAAIQIARALEARVAATAGSEEGLQHCRDLGAEVAINYRTEDFVQRVRDLTADDRAADDRAGGEQPHGADLILDNMGAKYLQRNVDALAPDGTLVVIGMQGGAKGELNLAAMLGKRATVAATGLRGRPVSGTSGKGAIVAEVVEHVWPLLGSGALRPTVHATYPMAEAAQAHRALEAGHVRGKIMLTS